MNLIRQRRLFQLTQIVLLSLIYVPFVVAQETQQPQLPSPPPIEVIPRSERAQLEQTKDAKSRIRLTIELAEAHLTLAEKYTAQPNFDAASAEVGSYHALLDDVFTFLAAQKHDSN